MSRYLREGCGALLLLAALASIALSVQHLREQEFVGALLLAGTGLGLLRGGVDLLRPSMGE